jgi:hypothetical protein
MERQQLKLLESDELVESIIRHRLLTETVKIKAKSIKFVRYGDLNPVKQAGYKKSARDGYGPPRKRGLYAFVWPYMDLGQIAMTGFDGSRHEWVRRKDGSKVQDGDADAGSFAKKDTTWLKPPPRGPKKKRGMKAMMGMLPGESPGPYNPKDYYLARLKKRKTFTYQGDIWHHLPTPEEEILDYSGKARIGLPGWWIKTSYRSWVRALIRTVGNVNKKGGDTKAQEDKGKYEVFIERL